MKSPKGSPVCCEVTTHSEAKPKRNHARAPEGRRQPPQRRGRQPAQDGPDGDGRHIWRLHRPWYRYGTVPLDKDEGLNVRIDWLGAKDSSKPKSRGAEHLTVKYPSAVGETTARRHTGAEYESGEVYAARGRNDADAGEHAIATSPQRCMTIILEPLGLT